MNNTKRGISKSIIAKDTRGKIFQCRATVNPQISNRVEDDTRKEIGRLCRIEVIERVGFNVITTIRNVSLRINLKGKINILLLKISII